MTLDLGSRRPRPWLVGPSMFAISESFNLEGFRLQTPEVRHMCQTHKYKQTQRDNPNIIHTDFIFGALGKENNLTVQL
jgi:hypothetical protein